MLIHGPQFSRLFGVGSLERLDHRRQLFLHAAWATGSAFAWRGRGTFGRRPRRRSISHPRWGYTGRPSAMAIQAATLGPVQSPPSGGWVSSAVARAARGVADSSPG
jgi:hypothetical protein